LQFDRELGADFWWKAIQKETVKVEVALKYNKEFIQVYTPY
jgi:hypothetical protein